MSDMVTSQEFYGCNAEAVNFLCIMLLVLLALHWWWYYLFVVIFIHFARSGKGRDLTAKTKADEVSPGLFPPPLQECTYARAPTRTCTRTHAHGRMHTHTPAATTTAAMAAGLANSHMRGFFRSFLQFNLL